MSNFKILNFARKEFFIFKKTLNLPAWRRNPLTLVKLDKVKKQGHHTSAQAFDGWQI